MANLVFHCQS